MALKLWQLLAVTSGIALAAGVVFGRYVVPHNGPETTFYRHLNDAYEARRGAAAAQQRTLERTQPQTAPPERTAANYVRAAIPALEAYNADHNSYAGATVPRLQHDYDAGIHDVTIVRADSYTYCLESTVDSTTYKKEGPVAEILPGRC
jgi:hypothetical protein